MYQVNRSVVVLKPKQPFLEWVLKVNTYGQLELTLDDIRRECTVLLLPNFDDENSALQYIYSQYATIFEMELEAWFVDESIWPANRTLKMFKEWIEVEFHPAVIDLVEDELEGARDSGAALH